MHIDFENDGYFVVRRFFDDTTIQLMQTYWDLKWRLINFCDEEKYNVVHSVKQGDTLTVLDGDVGYSYNFYSDHLMESIELCYGQKVCDILKANLSPTYTFTRIYEKGSPLIPHLDRPSCEISATCPITISDDRPSTICVSNFKWNEVTEKPVKFSIEQIKKKGDYNEINLYPGDLMFYRGCERYHWRDPIESDYLIQFFMHFVEADGQYKDFVFDKRPFLGFPDKYKSFL